ncbi:hypothetical protein HJC23_002249 [Cyclotella cryptica]|uniref:Plastid lipid-associated protein/fibrillin conserved domain-containing protein n=1 Tax=Cyclotella cryptica TaxID=29204 RepID=A0ABD3QHW7_9STRA|eukprot:CCRYP_005702-RA/>CCRYP_005702-RA protein AED:0.43 eAED:0.43 QI:0/-1/0/1/-1/1/1/0/180
MTGSTLLLSMVYLTVVLLTCLSSSTNVAAFAPASTAIMRKTHIKPREIPRTTHRIQNTQLRAAISEKEANAAINTVVRALKNDKSATSELGTLQKVNNILGYGSPKEGIIAVRFNASFQKGGMGRSAVPLPFGLGQSNKTEGRGTMVGQVKASVNAKTGKVVEASVFRDLGYGRAFNLKI